MKKTTKETLHPMILAIETATMCGSVALIARDHCLAEVSIDTPTTHSRRLIQQVDQVRHHLFVLADYNRDLFLNVIFHQHLFLSGPSFRLRL